MNAPYFTFMPLHRHFDGGFGAIGDAFKEAGDQLGKTPTNDVHRHLPATYLYRHAIEMYLKSMIVIIHEKFDRSSQPPLVLYRRKRRPFDSVHTLAGLWDCLKGLLDQHTVAIKATSFELWDELDTCESWLHRIDADDPSGTLLKYAKSGNQVADRDKESFKPINEVFDENTNSTQNFVKALVLEHSSGSVEAYMLDYSPIRELQETVLKCADFLSAVHFAMRCELTDGL
jgi:hypothetical protein